MLCTVLIAAALSAPTVAPSALVWPVEPGPHVSAALATVVSEELTRAVRHSGAFSGVQAKADLDDVVATTSPDVLFNCPSCVASLQDALAADVVIIPRLVWLDGRYALTIKLIRTRTAAVAASVTELLDGDDLPALLAALAPAVDRLLMEEQMAAALDVVDALISEDASQVPSG